MIPKYLYLSTISNSHSPYLNTQFHFLSLTFLKCTIIYLLIFSFILHLLHQLWRILSMFYKSCSELLIKTISSAYNKHWIMKNSVWIPSDPSLSSWTKSFMYNPKSVGDNATHCLTINSFEKKSVIYPLTFTPALQLLWYTEMQNSIYRLMVKWYTTKT